MGVPFAIILMIILIMSMFAIAAIIIYKNREKFGHQRIDPPPSSLYSTNKKNPEN
jgi:hypothetical protein